jgi:hypothetical protein
MEDDKNWSPDQLAKIEAWLVSKWGASKPCVQCGNPAMAVGPSPAVIINQTTTGTINFGGVYPSIAIICRNCGNTVMVNAILAGVVLATPSVVAANG